MHRRSFLGTAGVSLALASTAARARPLAVDAAADPDPGKFLATFLNDPNAKSKMMFKLPSGAEDVAAYLASGEWRGKAGGYAIQGRAAAFAPWIAGSYSGVVGLPIAETLGLLHAAGWRAA